MKIIASSIVLLAATASAEETSLRIGRRKLGPGGNGNGNGNAFGYKCQDCRVADDAENFVQECAKLSIACTKFFGLKCIYTPANAETGEDEDCFLVDDSTADSSDSDSKGGSGEE